jgi:protein SCO1/2
VRFPFAIVVVFVLATLVTTACSSRESDDARRFQLTGTIAGQDTVSSRVIVAHDEVKGLMPAMSMPFEIRGDAAAVRDGDRILATLVVTDSRSWLEDVRITATGGAVRPDISTTARALPGAVVPDFPLLDQNGRAWTMHDLAGRVVVMTFIYTRCPLPDFCPLMVTHLERIRRRAADEGIGSRLAFVGVTLDPEFDTPAVLRAYGESVLKGANRFDQWTLATGTAAQIADIARFFGVAYRADNGFVTHTLSTVVVSHDGRVMRTFPSNSWRPEELFDIVTRGLADAAAE